MYRTIVTLCNLHIRSLFHGCFLMLQSLLHQLWDIDQLGILDNLLDVLRPLLVFFPSHSLLVKDTLSLGLDLLDPFHGFERCRHQVSVIPNGNVAAFLEFQCRVLFLPFRLETLSDTCNKECQSHNSHLLSSSLSESLGPFEFTWVTLHFEVAMAF